MKKTSLIAALALVLALCLGLVGCGSSLEPEDATNIHCTWELVSGDGETEEDVLAEADVAMLKEYGMTCTLTLNEDGTGNMDQKPRQLGFRPMRSREPSPSRAKMPMPALTTRAS